jgi:hypothetical protein
MCKTHATLKLLLISSTFFGFFAPHAKAIGTVIVKNTGPNQATLSDLLVQTRTGQHTIIAPNNAADDVVIGPGGVKTFPVDSPVINYIISEMDGANERESKVLKARNGKVRKVAYAKGPFGLDLYPEIDDEFANLLPPPDGSSFSVINGYSLDPQLQGWFIGQSITLSNGAVSDPYTGNVFISSSSLSVVVQQVPEVPAPIGMLGLLSALRHSRVIRARTKLTS